MANSCALWLKAPETARLLHAAALIGWWDSGEEFEFINQSCKTQQKKNKENLTTETVAPLRRRSPLKAAYFDCDVTTFSFFPPLLFSYVLLTIVCVAVCVNECVCLCSFFSLIFLVPPRFFCVFRQNYSEKNVARRSYYVCVCVLYCCCTMPVCVWQWWSIIYLYGRLSLWTHKKSLIESAYTLPSWLGLGRLFRQ